MSSGRFALLASLIVYLLPIFGEFHGFILVGPLLVEPGSDWVWQIANWVLVLAVQALVFFCLRFCFRARARFPIRCGLGAALLFPLAWYVLSYGYMVAIPTWRLVESDPAPEKTDLAEVCKI